jgi:hypothetical protein
MENYKRPDSLRESRRPLKPETFDPRASDTSEASQYGPAAGEFIRRLEQDRKKMAFRRKWGGRALMVFGAVTTLGSCPFYAFSLIPGQSIAAAVIIMTVGLAILAGGSAVSLWRPRLKYHNEAMIVAMKNGNQLTSSRLALELDVSFEKAERIIKDLVRNGVAELDLDHQDPDHSLVYRIKGL